MNNNQTFDVNFIQEASQGTLTAYKGMKIKFITALADEQIIFIFLGLSVYDTISDLILCVNDLLRCRFDPF